MRIQLLACNLLRWDFVKLLFDFVSSLNDCLLFWLVIWHLLWFAFSDKLVELGDGFLTNKALCYFFMRLLN